MSRTMMVSVALLCMLTTRPPVGTADEDMPVRVQQGGVTSVPLSANLVEVKITSSEPNVATATWAKETSTLQVTGRRVGRARLAISAERVGYLRFEDRARPPTATGGDVDYYDFKRAITVTVVAGVGSAAEASSPGVGDPAAGSALADPKPGAATSNPPRGSSSAKPGTMTAAPPADPQRPAAGGSSQGRRAGQPGEQPESTLQPAPGVVASESVIVAVGRSRSATYPARTINVRAGSANPRIATATVSGDTLTIRGVARGDTEIEVAGETLQYVSGMSAGSLGRGAPSVDESYGFQQRITVTVTDGGRKPEPPKRQGAPPPSSTLVYEVRLFSKRFVSVPPGTQTIAPGLSLGDRQSADYEDAYMKVSSDPAHPNSLVIEGKKEGLTRLRPRLRSPSVPGGFLNRSIYVKVLPCDLTGEWTGSGGLKIAQSGDHLSVTRGKYVHRGEVDGRDFQAVHWFTSPDEMDPSLPAQVRKMLAAQNLALTIRGTITDCDWQVDAEITHGHDVKYWPDPQNPGGYSYQTEPLWSAVTFRRKDPPRARPMTSAETAGLRGR